jgi:hypothetical protein
MRRILVLVLVAAGCSGASKHAAPTVPPTSVTTPTERAVALCRSATPEPAHLASSEPTTIKDFRETTIATLAPSQAHRFSKLAPTDFGAWCWTGRFNAYSVYEVAVDGSKVLVVTGMQVGSAAEAQGRPSLPESSSSAVWNTA